MKDNKIEQWFSDLPGAEGSAVHVQSGTDHAVFIDTMKVIIVKDGEDHWFAQSMDIDYAAGGNSFEDVKRNFEVGLSTTIKAHIKRFGNIHKIIRSPEPMAWLSLLMREDCQAFDVSLVDKHEVTDEIISAYLPFLNISYYNKAA